MKTPDKHIMHLLLDYLENDLDAARRMDVERHLKECKTCTMELEQYQLLLKAMDQEIMAMPSSNLYPAFLERLEEEKHMGTAKTMPFPQQSISRSRPWVQFLRIAASITLLVGAFFFGKYWQVSALDSEMAILNQERLQAKQIAMLALLENQSASKRIQGVGYIDGFSEPDNAVVVALIDRLQKDGNANVRLAALEALSKFKTTKMVKEAFINSLSTEKNPSIQIALIHTLVEIQEKKAAVPMRRLLEQEDTQPFIKEKIKQVLPEIM